MLINSVIVNGRRVYKRGIGHVLKLMKYLESDPISRKPSMSFAWAIREFTDEKYPMLLCRFSPMKAMAIVESIVKVNIPKPTGSNSGSKSGDLESIAVGIVDTLASAYGWSAEYILDTIDLDTYQDLSKAISARRANDVVMAALVAHDPQQAIKIVKESQGIEEKSLAEAIAQARKAK